MAIKDKQGNWIDGRGKSVPAKYVDKVDKQRDKIVEKLFKKAQRIHKLLKEFKSLSEQEILAFQEYSQRESGVQVGGVKGNVTLSTFSMDKKIEVDVSERLDFDERLQHAKQLLDELLTEWTENARDELKVLITQAFETDKKGKLNVKAILNLRRIKIKHPKWKNAMDLIDEARHVSGSKKYIRFSKRDGQGKWKGIVLDFASISGE